MSIFTWLPAYFSQYDSPLSHGGPGMPYGITDLVTFSSDNDLLTVQCQAIIWSNADVWTMEPSGQTSEIWIIFFLQENVFENDVSNPKWQMFC